MKNFLTKHKYTILGTVAMIVVLLIGIAVGAGSAGGDTAAETAPAKTETVTKTVTVEKTPKVCVQALDQFDEVLASFGGALAVGAEYPPLIPEAAEAGQTMLASELDKVTDKILALNDELQVYLDKSEGQRDKLVTLKTACLAKAE